jgi:hypothetical protein
MRFSNGLGDGKCNLLYVGAVYMHSISVCTLRQRLGKSLEYSPPALPQGGIV